MWRSSRPSGETLRDGAIRSDVRKRWGAIRWRMVAAIGLALVLIVVLLVGWTHFTVLDDGGLRGTAWKQQKGNETITVEFSRLGYIVGTPVVTYRTEKGSRTGADSYTYTVLAEKTLTLAGGEQLTIDSKTNDKLVLSGGPWKLEKTELAREK